MRTDKTQAMGYRVARLTPYDVKQLREFVETAAAKALREWIDELCPLRDEVMDEREFAIDVANQAVEHLRERIKEIRWAALVDMQTKASGRNE